MNDQVRSRRSVILAAAMLFHQWNTQPVPPVADDEARALNRWRHGPDPDADLAPPLPPMPPRPKSLTLERVPHRHGPGRPHAHSVPTPTPSPDAPSLAPGRPGTAEDGDR